MPYLWSEKRFLKNSNGFEFHVHPFKIGEILAKIGKQILQAWKDKACDTVPQAI